MKNDYWAVETWHDTKFQTIVARMMMRKKPKRMWSSGIIGKWALV
jgi:hypothetical protein